MPPRWRRTSSASENTSARPKGDDGAARRQPRHLLVAGIGQRREARPADVFGVRGPAGASAAGSCRRRETSSRCRPRACSSRAVKTWPRSGSAQSWISSTARNSTGRSSGIEFDGADEIGRVRRQDLLLAGDQRHRPRAAQLDDPVVILPRQQAQREADHAASDGRACARSRDGSCRYWSARGPRPRGPPTLPALHLRGEGRMEGAIRDGA